MLQKRTEKIALYHKLAKICLALVLLIIVAGSVVRMTGSGMGCPDWPKCFGYYIPPTSAEAIVFKPNHNYKKGQVIQINKVFYYAKQDFKSANTLQLNNWQKNTTHNYNTFNVTHTWIEFINRLTTAVTGIPVLLLFVLSVFMFKQHKTLFFVATLVLLLMGFAAWLGKTVVDSNLMPTKISVHLLVAYLIVLVLTFGVFKSKVWQPIIASKKIKNIAVLVAVLTIIQIVLGVQVRQFVDVKIAEDVSRGIGYQQHLWLQAPELSFYVHRSFSIALLLAAFWLMHLNKKQNLHYKPINTLVIIMLAEVVVGIIMANLDFPILSQPLHLVLSAILLATQLFIILRLFRVKTNTFEV